jgi:hypothetical protein
MNTIADGGAVCERCGYRVPGVTESFTPISVTQDAPVGAEEPVHRFDLRIVRGPQTGVDIDLKEGILSVGRDPQCDIFLNDMTVSRLHAEIEVGARGCTIRDKNSFNGVWVNDRMVEACSLKPGDVIQIGAFCLIYREQL